MNRTGVATGAGLGSSLTENAGRGVVGGGAASRAGEAAGRIPPGHTLPSSRGRGRSSPGGLEALLNRAAGRGSQASSAQPPLAAPRAVRLGGVTEHQRQAVLRVPHG